MKKPKPHQMEAITSALLYFQNNDRGKLIMPCGSGKTLTALWIADVVRARSIVICLPNLTIEGQAVETWLTEMHEVKEERFKVLVLGSDKSISKRFEVVSTTSQSEVDIFVKTHEKSDFVIFTTYHSAHLLFGKEFDFGIFDEAHRTVSNSNSVYIERKRDFVGFSGLLYNENVTIKKRLFMTATEKNLKSDEAEAVSMDNVFFYGNEIYRLSMKDAIEQSILTDYKILTLFTKNSELKEAINRTTYRISLEDMEEESYLFITAISILRAIQLGYSRKIVTFHGTVDKAVRFSKVLETLAKSLQTHIFVATISGKNSAEERQTIIKKFEENTISVLANSRLLSEGLDVPDIDSISFADYKASPVDIIQCLGRALRKKQDGRIAKVIIPCLAENEQDFYQNKYFGRFQAIINALSWQDERIYYEFKPILNKGRNQQRVLFEQTNLFAQEATKLDLFRFYEEIELKTWQTLAKYNYVPYDEARTYLKNNCPDIKSKDTYMKERQLLPPDMPTLPDRYYLNRGWVSWMHFLGKTDSIKVEYASYEDAKYWVIKNLVPIGINNQILWNKYIVGSIKNTPPKPANIPSSPDSSYRKEWKNWYDFFGREKPVFVSYEVARRFMSLYRYDIVEGKQYKIAKKEGAIPFNMPSCPDEYYKEWVNWDTFLNKEMPLEDFRAFAKKHILPYLNLSEIKKSYDEFVRALPNQRLYRVWLPLRPLYHFNIKSYKELFEI